MGRPAKFEEAMSTFTCRLPWTLIEWIREKAAEGECSLSDVVRTALEADRQEQINPDLGPPPVVVPARVRSAARANGCPHPPGRIIGEVCGMCGSPVRRSTRRAT